MSEENINQPLSGGSVPENIRELLKCREALCRELAELPDAMPEQFRSEIQRISQAYENTQAPPPEFAELLDKQFSDAKAQAEKRITQLEVRQANYQKLAAKADEMAADTALGSQAELEKFDAACIRDLGSIPPEFTGKLRELRSQLEAEAALVNAEEEKVRKLIEELESLMSQEEVEPLKNRKSEIDKEFNACTRATKPLQKRFHEVSHKASAKISQYFETQDFARWESYTLKMDICKELENLNNAEKPDYIQTAKKLQELRDRWKQLGAVPKEKHEETNNRYLEVTRALQHKVDEFFANRRQERKQAAADKAQLIAEAEALSTSTDWNITAAAFKELQAKWKTIPRTGVEETALYQKFRAAADLFFNARSAYFAEKDRKFAVIIEQKEALIAEAEALTQENFRRARQLREDFRAAGGAGRAEADLAARFNAAMDKFFEQRKQAFAEKEKQSLDLISELEQLCSDPVANQGRAREIREKLKELESREAAAKVKKAVDSFEAALKEARKQENRVKGDLSRETAREIAAAVDRVLEGDKSPFTPPAAVEMFPRLNNAAKLITAVIDGDEKAADKLKKQIAAARIEHERICSELEKISGEDENGGDDLAAALQAAIMGNFAKAEAEAAARSIDPNRLASDYLNAGPLPSGELEESFVRFDAAMAKVR